VGRQERRQQGEQLGGRLFGEEVADVGDHGALQVVRRGLHGLADVVAEAHGAADGEHGHGQAHGLALGVLRECRVERPVEAEAGSPAT
jgi:hypothetical protein